MRVSITTAVALAVTACAAVPAASHARTLDVGFIDTSVLMSSDASLREPWYQRADALGVNRTRFNVSWRTVAPASPPASFDATDPGDPNYKWATIDTAVRAAAAHGIDPVLTVLSAPSWAEGANRRDIAPPGTWRPDPTRLRAFAFALARRYSGTYPDPLRADSNLPRVRHYQAWNEPNLNFYLSPQWQGRGDDARPRARSTTARCSTSSTRP